MPITNIASRETVQKEDVDFGLTDEKGRKVGCKTVLSREVHELSDEKWGWEREPGVWFRADTHASRNGEAFGALNPQLLTRDEAEARAWIEKRVAASRKSYAKKYGVAL